MVTLLSIISEGYPELNLYGIEFTPELFELARSRNLNKCKIILGDIRKSLSSFQDENVDHFDVIITERVIINLLDHREQRQAIQLIHDTLEKDGTYIQVESFFEPLVNLNRARKEMALSRIEPSEHNKFLNKYMLGFMRDRVGLREVESSIPTNYLSSYFFFPEYFIK